MDDSHFVRLFGKYPIVQVIDFFLENDIFDYSKTDICKQTGVGWSTLHLFWNKLVESGIIKETRKIGRAKLFKLNKDSPVAKALIKLDLDLSFAFAEKAEELKIPA